MAFVISGRKFQNSSSLETVRLTPVVPVGESGPQTIAASRNLPRFPSCSLVRCHLYTFPSLFPFPGLVLIIAPVMVSMSKNARTTKEIGMVHFFPLHLKSTLTLTVSFLPHCNLLPWLIQDGKPPLVVEVAEPNAAGDLRT